VGDSILATFPRAGGAVAFAVAFQEDMAREEVWHPGELPLRFRIGVHLAEVTVYGDDVVGLGVNLAHRLQQLAAPGGVCVSDEVRRELADQPDLAWRTLGWRRLHNIDGPVSPTRSAASRTASWRPRSPARRCRSGPPTRPR
jgi:adenylate cyclase